MVIAANFFSLKPFFGSRRMFLTRLAKKFPFIQNHLLIQLVRIISNNSTRSSNINILKIYVCRVA